MWILFYFVVLILNIHWHWLRFRLIFTEMNIQFIVNKQICSKSLFNAFSISSTSLCWNIWHKSSVYIGILYKTQFQFLAQKYPNTSFLLPSLGIFGVFCEIFQLDKYEGADFKYDSSFFQILARKYPNKSFLVPKLVVIFCEFLQLDKFEGAYFKYENIF